MSIPTPPADLSGGYMLIKATNGSLKHRMRFHLFNSFNADSTGTYVSPPGGMETNVQATATAVLGWLKAFYPSQWTLTLDAVYQAVSGTPIEIFTINPPSSAAGTNGSTDNGKAEEYICYSFRTLGGHHARFFVFSGTGWAYSAAAVIAGNPAGTTTQQMVDYFASATSGVRGHDGTKFADSCTAVWGVNKKIKRRVGDD